MAAMPALRSTFRTHPLATLGLVSLFLIAATRRVRDAGDRLDEMLYGEQYVSQSFYIDLWTFKVTTLAPPAK